MKKKSIRKLQSKVFDRDGMYKFRCYYMNGRVKDY